MAASSPPVVPAGTSRTEPSGSVTRIMLSVVAIVAWDLVCMVNVPSAWRRRGHRPSRASHVVYHHAALHRTTTPIEPSRTDPVRGHSGGHRPRRGGHPGVPAGRVAGAGRRQGGASARRARADPIDGRTGPRCPVGPGRRPPAPRVATGRGAGGPW